MEEFLEMGYAYGMWTVVAVNAAIFIFFALGFLKPRRRWEWRSMGALSAFIIALFTEMFGFPLTIYLLTSVLGSKYPVTNPFSHINGNLWAVFSGGSEYLSGLLMITGEIIMLAGLIIVGLAWRQIHRAKGKLVTSGLYRFLRHPQYFGISLVITAALIQWPTIITLVMYPILMLMYYRLARREEREMESRFGEEYLDYKQQVPMLYPRLVTAPGATRA